MSIVVQCPHCETKFNLQPDLNGKSMRCPNLDCRRVFTVRPLGGLETPPPPPSTAGPIPVPLPPEPGGKPKKPEKPRPPAAPPKPAVVDAEIVEAAVVSPPKVKEVVWSEGTDVPPAPGKGGKKSARPVAAEEPEDDDPPVTRRKKQKSRRPLLLLGLAVTAVALVGFGVVYLMDDDRLAEARFAAQAEKEYKEANYPAAAASFDKLAAAYPAGGNAARYKFFAELSRVRADVGAVTNRENPDPVVERFRAFLDAQKDSPFAKPGTGYGRDIVEAGKKLGEDIAAHADDRVKAFVKDRSNSGELDRADRAVALGRALLSLLAPFTPDEPPAEGVRKDLDRAEKDVKRERDRTAALAKARARLEKLTDAAIQLAEGDLAAAGFISDPEAKELIAGAKGKLRDLVKYEPDPAAPRNPPASAAATLLFVTAVGPTAKADRRADDAPPAVFLAVARGVLYALDEDTGALRWAVRVGPDTTDPPAVARVVLEDGPTDLAVVTSNVNGEPAVSGYVVRADSPTPRWYQPLPAPAAGPAVVVGTRAYVAVRDEHGTVFEFDLTGGTRRGRIRLGQPAGPAMVLRPGTGLLYAAADARRVYVIDADAKDGDGNPADPRCVQVIATGHPTGTLRTPPVLVGPGGDAPGERWLVLSQASGPTSMKLRAFAVPPVGDPGADGKAPPEATAAPAVELPVPGWAWFPPVGDGENLAVVTDAGQFRLFGVNQPGNFDKALFPIPGPVLPAPEDGTAVPGLVFPSEESAFWVLANGGLQKYRLGLVPSKAFGLTPTGPRLPLGVPTQPPQVNPRRDAACLVVRSVNSAGCAAVLVGLRDGAVRWQRQLGVVPAAPPLPIPGGLLLAGEDGGLVAVPAASGATSGRTTVAAPGWAVAPPPPGVVRPTAVAASSDGKTVYTVTTVGGDAGPRFVVRRIVAGRLTHRGGVNAPAHLKGAPVVCGESLLIPAEDGFVYRHVPGSPRSEADAIDTLVAGPRWGADGRPADAVCHLTPLGDGAFLTNDGGKKLTRWDWPVGGQFRSVAATWDLREVPVGPGVLLPASGGPPRFLIADAAGSVWLFPADRGGPPLRRWRPTGGSLPGGKPTSPVVLQPDPTGRLTAAYTVDGKYLVCLDPERDLPLWAVRTGEDADTPLVGPPQPAGAGKWLTTDLAGRVTVFDAEGRAAGSVVIGLPGAVPAAAASPAGGSSVLVSLSDGSAVVLGLPGPAPEPRGKE